MKITYLGKEIDRPRDRAGRYALSLWNREKAKARKVYAAAQWWTKRFIAPVALLVLIAAIYGMFTNDTLVAKNVHADTDPFAAKITLMQDEVLDALERCESGGAPKDAALVIFDQNSKGTLSRKDAPSLGSFQFKVSTVQNFEQRRSGKRLTNYEATLLALDHSQARELARYAIFGTQGGIFHWSCANEAMVAKVSVIKELMQ
jgi:hypothetical protein